MKNRRRETLTALAFASPWFIGFSVFLLYPLLSSLYYSFCDYSVLRAPIWVGMENYADLYHDPVFWTTTVCESVRPAMFALTGYEPTPLGAVYENTKSPLAPVVPVVLLGESPAATICTS